MATKNTKLKVAVLCGGPSAEHDVSLASGRNVFKALKRDRFDPQLVVWEKEQPLERAVDFRKFDLVFVALHGPFGEDGTVQAFFEFLGVPYTGSGVAASALGMDKVVSKIIFQSVGIPTPDFAVANSINEGTEGSERLGFPCVVKPSSQGSSVGVSVVRKSQQLPSSLEVALSFGEKAIIERYVEGREFSCGVLGNKEPLALPLVEVLPKKAFFDYEAKYTPGMAEEIIPARLGGEETRGMQDLAVRVYQTLGCRGFGRVDILLSRSGDPYVLEINTIPGMTENSLLPKEAEAAGIALPELMEMIINFALRK